MMNYVFKSSCHVLNVYCIENKKYVLVHQSTVPANGIVYRISESNELLKGSVTPYSIE